MTQNSAMPRIAVRPVNYGNPGEAAALVELIDGYAQDVAGGGKRLPSEVRQGLAQALHQRPDAFSVMPWAHAS